MALEQELVYGDDATWYETVSPWLKIATSLSQMKDITRRSAIQGRKCFVLGGVSTGSM